MDPCPTCKACDRVGRKSQPVTYFCTDCDEPMCKDCALAHDKFLKCQHTKRTLDEYHDNEGNPKKKTKIGEFGPDVSVCRNHTEINTNLLCQDCKKFLCKDCLILTTCFKNDTLKHTLVEAVKKQSGAPNQLKAICTLDAAKALLRNLTEKNQAFQIAHTTTLVEMERTVAHFIQLLNNVSEEKKRGMSHEVEKHMSKFSKDKKEIESFITELTKLVYTPSTNLTSSCPLEMVKGYSGLMNKLYGIPPGMKVQAAKFEFCKTLEVERLVAHAKSTLGFPVGYKIITGLGKITDAVYAEKRGLIFASGPGGIYRLQEDESEIGGSTISSVHGQASHRLCLSEDQKQLFASSLTSTILVFSIGEKGEIKHLRDIAKFSVISSLAIGKMLPDVLVLEQIESAGCCKIGTLAFSPDRQTLATIDRDYLGCYSTRVKVFNLDGTLISKFSKQTPVGVHFLDDCTLCVAVHGYLEGYSLMGVLFKQPNLYKIEKKEHKDLSTVGLESSTGGDWDPAVLWKKRLGKDTFPEFSCAAGMIFLKDGTNYKVLNRHGDDVGVLTCPEGDPVSVCAMNNGMLMVISSI